MTNRFSRSSIQTFADRVKVLRQEKSLSASDLAKLANVTPAAVWNWEKNGTMPREATITALADKLGVTSEFLVTGDEGTVGVPATKPAAAKVVAADVPSTGFEALLANASLEDLIRAIEAKGFHVTVSL